MSLWSDYLKELRGEDAHQFIELPWGFVSYSFPQWAPTCIQIEDMYVVPEERKLGRGNELLGMVQAIGLKAGKLFVTAQLELNTLTFENAMRVQLAAGFIPIAAENGKIYLRRDC